MFLFLDKLRRRRQQRTNYRVSNEHNGVWFVQYTTRWNDWLRVVTYRRKRGGPKYQMRFDDKGVAEQAVSLLSQGVSPFLVAWWFNGFEPYDPYWEKN